MRRAPLWSLAATAVLIVTVLAAPTARAQQTPGLSEARQRADRTTRAVLDLEAELGEMDADLVRLETETEAAEAELEGLRARVRELAIEQYTGIGRDEFAFLTDDINEAPRARVLASVVTQTDRDAVDEYRATKARLDRAAAELADRRAEQEGKLEQLAEQRERLDRELADLERQEAERIAAERAAAEEARRAAAAAEAARAASAGGGAGTGTSGAGGGGTPTTTRPGAPAPAPGPTPGPAPAPVPSGSWICPVQGARSFVDSWGAPRPGGRAHQGVDLMSPRGTPVVTPVSGTVMLKTGGIGGLTFRLSGDDGNWYYGAHLDSYAGAEGRLPAGTVVGYVGDTGDAKGTGTHLHFEIHKGGYGNPVNPYPTVARYC